MSTRVFLRFVFMGSLFFLFFLSSCGSTTTTPTPFIPNDALDVYGINVYISAQHTMNVNQPYQVSALISSPDSTTPLTSLYGIFPYGDHTPQHGFLYQLLQPSDEMKNTVKTFELCLYITLDVDQSAFTVDPTTQKQWVTLAQDGNHAQNSTIWNLPPVVWNVTPRDPDGIATQDYNIGVDIGFDAKVSCDSSSRSLLPIPYSFEPTEGDHSVVKTTTTTVIDEQLVRENELVDIPRKIIGALLPTVQTILLGWVTGIFSWIYRQLKGSKSPESNQNAPPVALLQEKKQISGCRRASCIAGIVVGALMMVGALFSIYLDAYPTIRSVFIETTIALVGMALMIAGAWWIQPGRGVRVQEKPV